MSSKQTKQFKHLFYQKEKKKTTKQRISKELEFEKRFPVETLIHC
jgi:hypothetical protein